MRASLIFVACLATAASAADLGTLFHTPKERETLEKLRRGESTVQGAAIVRPDPVLTGYVKRSDGKSTAFIDKQPVPVRNPKLESQLQPRLVDRFEPWPMPVAPADEGPKPVEALKPGAPKLVDGKATTPSLQATTPPAPAKRADKGG